MTSQFDDPDLPDLVSAAMEMQDEGVEPSLETICAGRPDLIPAVRESLEASLQIQQIHQELAGEDRFVGKLLGNRYKLEHRLGSGAMGVVYRAVDQELNRAVAIKILRSAFLETQESEARFLREAEVLASIKDERIVRVFDRGRTQNDDPYIVMELLEGASLAELLDRANQEGATSNAEISAVMAQQLGIESLPSQTYLRTAARWAADIAGGLDSAHRQSVFHRDVKPSNIFICKDGRAKLIDFGIAAQQEQATLTREGAALGTPAYIAPEALKPGEQPGPGLDIYGLCASLYHLLALRPPFSGTPSQILSSLATRPAKPLSRRVSNVPRDLLAIVETGMARRVADRFPDAEALGSDLNAFLSYRPVQARRMSPLTRGLRQAWRSVAVRTLMAAVAVALLAGGGLWLQDRWAAQRHEVLVSSNQRLLPALTIQDPVKRRFTDPEERRSQEDLLNSCVGASPSALPYRAYRAAFLLDQDDLAGAVRDMQAIARDLKTPLSRDLAVRYGNLELKELPSYALDLDSLPEPSDSQDRFLLGFHYRREGRKAEAREVLSHASLREVPHAQAILLHCAGGKDFTFSGHLRGGSELELLQGYRSADTSNHIGAALVALGRYAEAVPVLEEGIQLAPTSTGLHTNLARAAWRLGDRDKALACYETSIRLRPEYLKTHELLFDCLLDFMEVESAREALEAAPAPFNSESLARYRSDLGELETVAAIRLHAEKDFDACHAKAEEALDYFAQAQADGHKLPVERPLIARALLEGGNDKVCQDLLQELIAEPWNFWLLRTVHIWRPTQAELSPETESLLFNALAAVAEYGIANHLSLNR